MQRLENQMDGQNCAQPSTAPSGFEFSFPYFLEPVFFAHPHGKHMSAAEKEAFAYQYLRDCVFPVYDRQAPKQATVNDLSNADVLEVLNNTPAGVTFLDDAIVIKMSTEPADNLAPVQVYRQLYADWLRAYAILEGTYETPTSVDMPITYEVFLPSLMPSGLNNPVTKKEGTSHE